MENGHPTHYPALTPLTLTIDPPLTTAALVPCCWSDLYFGYYSWIWKATDDHERFDRRRRNRRVRQTGGRARPKLSYCVLEPGRAELSPAWKSEQ